MELVVQIFVCLYILFGTFFLVSVKRVKDKKKKKDTVINGIVSFLIALFLVAVLIAL